MPDNDNFLADPRVWLSALALVVSCFSALIAWRSMKNASRALSISESQEKRRQPQLRIYLANGFRRLLPKRQLFGFLVSVSNPTDINDSVVRAELRVTYLVVNGAEVVCRLNHNAELREHAVTDAAAATVFSLPARIDAHQTVSGWFLFVVDNEVLRNGTIDAHTLILEDTHGVLTVTDPIMVREWADETKKG